MHQVIRAIVYAQNEKDALFEAKEIFGQLVDAGIFDYFVTFDVEGSVVAGKDRWGDLPIVVRTDSKEGKKLIQEGMEATKREFLSNMQAIRKAMEEHTDEELFEDRDDMLKHYLYRAGMYGGCCIWLYDQDGEGIRDTEHLNDVLNKWKDIHKKQGEVSPYEGLDIWVVPADVHH